MLATSADFNGTRPVPFLYGTAWKEDQTRRLTELALAMGLRGIDTANQRRHYHEAAVGEAIAASLAKGIVTRAELFLQTKFTFRDGQDHRLPYDANAPIGTQVEQSFASSLAHLGVDAIDSYLLHGPMFRAGLCDGDWEASRAIEAIHASGRASLIGVSNFTLEQLERLCAQRHVRPHFVQNRCFAINGWDYHVRQFCRSNHICHQGFSLLTANRDVLNQAVIASIAQRHGCTVNQVIFSFALSVGMLPLTGTSNPQHMREDLQAAAIHLDPHEIVRIEGAAVGR